MKKITREKFLLRAREKHGDKYDYSRVHIEGMLKKVVIICPLHGAFTQSPQHHLRGGCNRCGQANARATQAAARNADPDFRDRKRRRKAFIARARTVHGDRYDYSRVVYVNVSTKVEVVCRKHGAFFVTPDNHFRSGCPKCWAELKPEKCGGLLAARKTDFLRRAKDKYGTRYDYQFVEYVNAHKKVLIICPEHGGFFQTPDSHVTKGGCNRCGRLVAGRQVSKTMAGRSVAAFLTQALSRFGSQFAYDAVTEENIYGQLPIHCPVHGVVHMPRRVHLRKGCPECSEEQLRIGKRDDFIAAANTKHGDRYDYSRVEWVNATTKVRIVCPEHGDFWQEPWRHLSSAAGCLKCGWVATGQSLSLTQDEFLGKAVIRHGPIYDYSEVEYRNNHTKVVVICGKHGRFLVAPEKHLCGTGCPACGRIRTGEKLRTTPETFVKQAKLVHGDRYDYSCVRYIDSEQKWEIACTKHGPWTVSLTNHIGRASGCPKCTVSIGHELIRTVLVSLNTRFEEEKRFLGLGALRYDFFVADRKLLIEYDGIQHFEPIEVFGGAEALRKTKLRDRRKNQWAQANNMTLLRIRYDQDSGEIFRLIAASLGKAKNEYCVHGKRRLRLRHKG